MSHCEAVGGYVSYDLVLEHKESSTDALHETGGPALVESLSSVFARTRGHGTEG
jgi:hypothetical protein